MARLGMPTLRKLGIAMVGGVVVSSLFDLLTEKERVRRPYPNQRAIYVSTPEKFEEIVKKNLKDMFRNLDKSDLLLRNGDLVFIRYNLSKLSRFDRLKLIISRRFSKDRIYDDLGIVYTKGNELFIVLLPSITLKSTADLKELNIKKGKFTGVVAIEYDDLIDENCPHLLSVRRLVCLDSVRKDVIDSLKSTITDLESSINCSIVSIFNNRRDPVIFGINCPTFAATLTALDELKFTKKSLENNVTAVFDAILPADASDKRLDGKLSNAELEELVGNINKLISMENLLKVCEQEMEKYHVTLCKFLKKTTFGEGIYKANFLSSESDLVSRTFAKSRLLPLRNELGMFNITHYLQLDALCDLDSGGLGNISRLSSPFHAFTGEINEARVKNLIYEPLCNRLEFYRWMGGA